MFFAKCTVSWWQWILPETTNLMFVWRCVFSHVFNKNSTRCSLLDSFARNFIGFLCHELFLCFLCLPINGYNFSSFASCFGTLYSLNTTDHRINVITKSTCILLCDIAQWITSSKIFFASCWNVKGISFNDCSKAILSIIKALFAGTACTQWIWNACISDSSKFKRALLFVLISESSSF